MAADAAVASVRMGLSRYGEHGRCAAPSGWGAASPTPLCRLHRLMASLGVAAGQGGVLGGVEGCGVSTRGTGIVRRMFVFSRRRDYACAADNS